ncbi:50S ribosomal protein L29 [Helicobacter mustelae]|uniref:Large ribosomal subunit protein uL29 n=1 Tax=Helicobacter mustelae (strain ATCC 43772 / CCUG 25715 / CIP 103759 / LMG 18044 / NCTC 12198 / R85-136P) TaxID=679897 RepID=D3UII1_HELM1|nr:50S ribosomal protein L29 [Helicobacter mustelae]CBG40304.1 50S ribosomal protein L29 [Helicobacter mustelae 12198]SQH71803.1 50S ribosomal protein L29 [Helicobacter mustelae]STP12932.1 50S ribosomal protein L29 [Helicobacter mustelae]
MKFIDLKDKDLKELNKMLKEKKAELFEMRLKLKTMQLTNSSQIAAVRKDIARINTAISAKNDSFGRDE